VSRELTSNAPSGIITDMRTTLRLDDDVLVEARRYAESRSMALGEAVSELVRKALSPPVKTRMVNGIAVFDLPADSPRITSARVKELLEDDDEFEGE